MTSIGGPHRPLQKSIPSHCRPQVDSDHDPLTTTFYEPTAIVGLSLRFSGEATSTEAFWNMMLSARCTISDIPSTRLNHEAFRDSGLSTPGTIRPSKAHFLSEDISQFDSTFFNVSDAEAIAMDPQQRILLETTYHALENGRSGIEYTCSKWF
jgi:acyl transferase domain-containing protein